MQLGAPRVSVVGQNRLTIDGIMACVKPQLITSPPFLLVDRANMFAYQKFARHSTSTERFVPAVFSSGPYHGVASTGLVP